jgi:hypothetical protein
LAFIAMQSKTDWIGQKIAAATVMPARVALMEL